MKRRSPKLVRTLLLLLILCNGLLPPNLWAQETTGKFPYLWVGALAGIQFLENKTELPILAPANDCGYFGSGNSTGFYLGAQVDYPLFDNYFDVSGRFLFSRRPATLQAIQSNYSVLDANNKYVPLLLENTYTATLDYLLLDIGARFFPAHFIGMEIPVYVRGAFDVGNPVIGNAYEQTQTILEPSSVLYPGIEQRVKTIQSGNLQSAGTALGASGAIGATIKIRGNVYATPEVGFRKGLNSVVSTDSWMVQGFFASMGFQYAFIEPTLEIPAEPVKETKEREIKVVEKKAPVPLMIQSFNTNPLEVMETVVTETYPLLPYVFFDSTKSELRARYEKANATSFNEQQLQKQTLTIYYNMLNIVGKRLRENPTATITLTGTTDGKELGTYTQRAQLASDRAKQVADYLQTTWSINASRIQIVTRDFPELYSNPAYTEGAEENRRVEISSTMAEILAPVVHSRFHEFTPIQNMQTFSVAARNPELARAWDANVSKSSVVARVSGDTLPKLIPIEIDSSMMISLGKEISEKDSLRGVLTVRDKDGYSVSAECMFPIIKTKNTYEVSRLSLIVFDFDKSEITGVNKTMMEKFVQEAIKPTSIVRITGSTDRLGEMEYNKTLSQSRADATKTTLLAMNSAVNLESVTGLGASLLPYDNDVPEGRYYCRTVSIVVKTPVQK